MMLFLSLRGCLLAVVLAVGLLLPLAAEAGTRRYCMDFSTRLEGGKTRRYCAKFGVRPESAKEAAAGRRYQARQQERQVAGAGVMAAAVTGAAAMIAAKPADAALWRSGTVARVIDGDTLELTSGERVRLLDINTPELAHPSLGLVEEPGAQQAKVRATQLAQGQRVQLRLGTITYDDYGRLLAHVLVPGTQVAGRPLWLNGTLVQEGLAVVYTFADNRVYPQELLALEQRARADGRGLWALPRWQVRAAETCCAAEDVGQFVLVRGTVRQVVRVGDRWFLNFGPRGWQQDFSVEIAKGDASRYFREIEPVNYSGRRVVVRGMLKPVDGMMMRVTHPEQITGD